MNISLILAHPSQESLNHALASAAAASLTRGGHTVSFHDLYVEGFNPLLTREEIEGSRSSDPLVERHCQELQRADGLVLVHPVWFFGVPAIMKGWVDRVVREGVAFRRKPDGTIEGLLRAQVALVLSTANSTQHGDDGPVMTFWRDSVLRPCRVAKVQLERFAPVVSSTPTQRAKWLGEASLRVDDLFPPAP